MTCCDIWDLKWENRNIQTWNKNIISYRSLLWICFVIIILFFFCSQLHWKKYKSYLFKTIVVYFSIMWLRMYEVVKSCHIFPTLVGLLFIWSITDTYLTPLCTCSLAFNNNKFFTVLYLPPIPRITSNYNLCGSVEIMFAPTVALCKLFSFPLSWWWFGADTFKADQLGINSVAARTWNISKKQIMLRKCPVQLYASSDVHWVILS